jgi:ABC-2 type transport system ATP-binding protein
LAALVAALLMILGAAASPAAASGGFRTESRFIDVVDGPANDQHVRIDTTFYVPAGASASQPVPAIIGAHGFGQDKGALATDAEFLAGKGYAVLLYSARGFGNSTGRIGLDSPDYEVKDVEQLVDWLGTQPEVKRDATGPVVGMFGESYGGAMALLAAAYDPRIRVVVPILTWNSLVSSFLPNDASGPQTQPATLPGTQPDTRPAVFKQAWASVFLGGLPSLGGGSGGPAQSPPSSPCPTFVDTVCQAYVATAEAGQAPPSALAVMEASSPASVIGRIRIPTLLIQGEDDTLFDLDQAEANAAGIAANGAPVKTVWIPGGHGDLGALSKGSVAGYVESAAGTWFDRWLKGETSADTGGPALWYDATTGHYLPLSAAAVPVGTVDTLFPAANGRLVDQAASVRPGTVGFANPAGGEPDALSLDPTGSFLSSLPAFDIPGQNATFDSAPLGGAVQVVGAPRLTLTVSSSTPDLELFVKLYDVASDATATLPGGQVAPILLTGLTPGQPQDVTVTFPPIVHRFGSGDRIRLVVAATDSAYTNLRTASVYRVTIAPGGTTALTLPTQPVPAGSGHTAAYGILAGAVLVGLAVVVLTRRRPTPAAAALEAPGAVPAAVMIAGLTKRFRGGFLAVDDLSFTIGAGQVFGLLGPNGAGKTTTIRMLIGLVYPTAGATAIFGETMRPGHPVLARVGTLVEGPKFVPHLSGIDNLRLYWQSGGASLAEANMEEALTVAELGEAINRPVKTYSQGMRQRLGIAQALLGHPELLILDEPTNGLDPQQMFEMRQVIRRLADRGITVLLSSHLLGEVEQVCTHAAIMDHGRLVAAGTVAELIGTSPTVYVEADDLDAARAVLVGIAGPDGVHNEGTGLVVDLGGARPSDIAAALVGAGIGLMAMTPRRHLEDVFLGLIEDERGHPGGTPAGTRVP